MQTLTIHQSGNSAAVTIPRDYMKELGLAVGQNVVMEPVFETKSLVITPATNKTTKPPVSAEFKKWLGGFLEEDGDLLDELAER